MTVPDRTKLFGLLHDPTTGAAIRRQVRVLKCGIGIPKGPDVHVWIDAPGKWCVEVGRTEDRKRKAEVKRFEERAEAQAAYGAARKTAELRGYPAKIPYFTFLRMGISGDYVHDFDAIEQHGPIPNEIDVVFLTDAPLDAQYQWFTETRLNCEGDGRMARRRLEAATAEDQTAFDAATAAGEKWFPIAGCYTAGCPFARATMDGDRERPPRCKPHGRLFFQLVNQPRFGGTASFDTTGWRSISQLFSCIQEIKMVTGRGDPARGYIAGIPMKLVLRPYRALHNGKASVQYGVSLEYRAENALVLAQRLLQQGQEFRQVLAQALETSEVVPEARRLVAPEGADPAAIDPGPEDPDADAPAMAAEFYPAEEDPEDGVPAAEPTEPGISMPRRKSEAGERQTEGK